MGRRLVAIALALTATACAVPRGARAPANLPSAESLRQIVHERRDALHSLRAESHISVSGAQRSGSAREVLLVQRPDQLRVEVFSLLGTAFVLTATDGHLAAYVRSENRFYRGPATPDNLARYTGVPLAVPDVVELLMGVPPQRSVGYGSVFWDPVKGQVRLWQSTSRGVQVVAFAGSPLVPAGVEERSRDDRLLWRASFSDYVAVGALSVPRSIHFEIPDLQEHVDIELDSPEVNRPLAESLFALNAPPGSEEVRLDAAN